MHIFKEIEPLKVFLKQKKAVQQTIGLVPTMGALHAGHLSLITASKSQNHVTVCSLYVNPTQFNNASDLEKYPRTLPQDIALLEKAGCEVLFSPADHEMYGQPGQLKFDFGQLDKILEGQFRPGHFSGVALVVSKLFHIVQPDNAYFGKKDFQQLRIVSLLAEELKFGIRLHGVATLREPDGLAMSSRNARLNAADRQKATIFFSSLRMAKEALKANIALTEVRKRVHQAFESAPGTRLEYFEAADHENLTLFENVKEPSRTVLLIAGFVGEVRLIDNMMID
jgi:pantoate--beta-alanine ligase